MDTCQILLKYPPAFLALILERRITTAKAILLDGFTVKMLVRLPASFSNNFGRIFAMRIFER